LIKGENNRTISGQHRLIQEERSTFWEATVSGIVGEKSSYGHASNCEGCGIQPFATADINPLHFCLWGWMKSEVCKRKVGYSRRIAGSHFGCSCQHKETWRSSETNNTRSSHTSCKMHWGWRWDFRTFSVNCNTSVI